MNIGGYEIGQVFHIGTRGPLWRTRTAAGDALLALRSAADGDRFFPRWKAWASVTSRHVVRLRDVVRSDDGRWALVQDYVAGRSLDTELGSPDFRPIATRRQIFEGIAAGVSALHAAGIAHGDLTPANIMITPEGRAVIVDLIDELGEREGTPGWSLEASGMDGDRACLRQIAHLLGMDEALAEFGLDTPGAIDRGTTPVVNDPPEHVISREPVDPEQVIADLRAAALREDTVTEDEAVPRRKKKDSAAAVGRPRAWQRGRKRRIGLLVLGIVAILAGLLIIGYGVWGATNRQEGADASADSEASGDTAQSQDGLCDPDALGDVINHAIRVRDQAVVDGDPASLESVLGGELLAQDTQRIETMLANGVRVKALSSTVDNITVRSCESDAIEAQATLTVLTLETCRADTCEQGSVPDSTDLLVRVDPASRKVVSAAPDHA